MARQKLKFQQDFPAGSPTTIKENKNPVKSFSGLLILHSDLTRESSASSNTNPLIVLPCS